MFLLSLRAPKKSDIIILSLKSGYSMEEEESFSGFMPMVNQINLTEETTMLNTEGDLVMAHTIKLTTREDQDYVFSIGNHDLMRLYFLIAKVLGK